MLSLSLVLLLVCAYATEGLRCSQCYNYNGQVCLNSQDCSGNYCLYEEITQTNGIITTRKTCLSQPYYKFDDGSYITDTESCFSKRTNSFSYRVKICNYGNNCNSQCVDTPIYPPMTTTPEYTTTITPNTFPPIDNGLINCYSCTNSDGVDCTTGSCQGKYCLYERKITGNQMTISKSCTNTPVIQLNDGTLVETIDICEVRNTADSTYYTKICEDVNNCNGYCTPGQRQPLITCPFCEATNAKDCYNNNQVCQGNYCYYEYQRNMSSGAVYVSKGCSTYPYLVYPDSTKSSAINYCEKKVIGLVEFNVKVCNNGNACSTACTDISPSPNNVPNVVCTQCSAENQEDCGGNTCYGPYCLFERQIVLSTGQSRVKKFCSSTPNVTYPDHSSYTANGQCEYKNINGTNYSVRVCNSNNCNVACSIVVSTSTQSPQPLQPKSTTCFSLMFSSIFMLALSLLLF